MLKFKFMNFSFFSFFQSGLYLDYFIKKIIEMFMKNFFLLASLYFGEKFIVEYLTKKTMDSLIFNYSKYLMMFELLYSKFFLLILFFFWSLLFLLF